MADLPRALNDLVMQLLALDSRISLLELQEAPAAELGIFVGARAFAAPPPVPFDGNPNGRAALGLSDRELEVLHELAAGRSNKEIAARLHVSPNTVKTHVARVLDKLDARRRTEAIRRARELGLLP